MTGDRVCWHCGHAAAMHVSGDLCHALLVGPHTGYGIWCECTADPNQLPVKPTGGTP